MCTVHVFHTFKVFEHVLNTEVKVYNDWPKIIICAKRLSRFFVISIAIIMVHRTCNVFSVEDT